MAEEKEKKKSTFRKIEDGMILESEDGKTYAFGLPEVVEKMTGAEGKAGVSIMGIGGEVKGQQYSRVKYQWHIVPKEKKELTDEQINRFSGSIVTASGTIPTTYATYAYSKEYKACGKCGASNPTQAKFCLNCGAQFESVLRKNY